MEKKVSACVMIYDPVKRTLVAEHPTGKAFYKKGTKERCTGVMSLPKGGIEEGEEPIDAAIRETFEETGLKLEKSKLKYLGHYEYTIEKDLEMFYYQMEDVNLSSLKCTSYFDRDGKKLPEVNGFANLVIDTELEMFFPSLRKVITQVQKEFGDLF